MCWPQAHAAAKHAQRQAVVTLRDSQVAEQELMQNGPELEGGEPNELRLEVAQKEEDLAIYEQQVRHVCGKT